MSLESSIADLVRASTELTGTVRGQSAAIDATVNAKIGQMDAWMVENTPERRYVTDITIHGSKDYFYPVWWRLQSSGAEGIHKVSVGRYFSWNGKPGERPLNPDSEHQASLLLELEGSDTAWAGGPNFMEVKRFAEMYHGTVSHVAFAMYCRQYRIDTSKPVYVGVEDGSFGAYCQTKSGLYLRGGGLRYRIVTNQALLEFGFDNGAGGNRVIETANHVNTRWEVSPIPASERIGPPQTLKAYVGG